MLYRLFLLFFDAKASRDKLHTINLEKKQMKAFMPTLDLPHVVRDASQTPGHTPHLLEERVCRVALTTPMQSPKTNLLDFAVCKLCFCVHCALERLQAPSLLTTSSAVAVGLAYILEVDGDCFATSTAGPCTLERLKQPSTIVCLSHVMYIAMAGNPYV